MRNENKRIDFCFVFNPAICKRRVCLCLFLSCSTLLRARPSALSAYKKAPKRGSFSVSLCCIFSSTCAYRGLKGRREEKKTKIEKGWTEKNHKDKQLSAPPPHPTLSEQNKIMLYRAQRIVVSVAVATNRKRWNKKQNKITTKTNYYYTTLKQNKTKKTNIFILLLSQMYQGGGCRSPGLVFSCVWPAFYFLFFKTYSSIIFSFYLSSSLSLLASWLPTSLFSFSF